MTVRQLGRRIFLVLTLLVTSVATALASAFGGVGLYFLIRGGPELVRYEFSGEAAAARRASGGKAPITPLGIFVVFMGAGFVVGIRLWKAATRRSGKFEETEIQAVLRM